MTWFSIIADFRDIIADFQAQRVDEKNGVICLVMFIPRVMVVKMSKMVCFLYFLLMSDKLVTVWAKYSSDPEKSSWLHSKNGMVNKLWSYRSWGIEGRSIKKTAGSAKK